MALLSLGSPVLTNFVLPAVAPGLREPLAGKDKYGYGNIEAAQLRGRFPAGLENLAADLINASLAEDSWRQIESVKRKLRYLTSTYSVDTSLPMTPETVTNVITALIADGLRASSIKTYLGLGTLI